MNTRHLAVFSSVALASSAFAAPTWSLAHENPTGTSTTQMRSLAVERSAGEPSVYVGFIQTSNPPAGRTVKRFDSAPGYAQMNERGPSTSQPKAIAADERGNVYIGYRLSGSNVSELVSANSTFASTLDVLGVGAPNIGGMGIQKSGANYYAYVSYEGGGLIQRYDVTDPANIALDTTWGSSGNYNLPVGSGVLRGVEVDSAGNLWVANRDDGKIYRVSADLTTVSSADVPRAFDVALFDGRAYVTSYNGAASLIRVLDQGSMSFVEDFSTVSSGFVHGTREGHSGIDIGADGRIWLVDQDYATGSPVRDRLLVSSPIPAPAMAALFGIGGLVAGRRRRA